MQIGDIVTGKITGIKPYGIFIKYENTTGFCHISNVSNKFIKNLNDLFTINQEITTKIIKIEDDNKINVSIKDYENNVNQIKQKNHVVKKESKPSFEDMLKNYIKSSDEKLGFISKRDKKHHKR